MLEHIGDSPEQRNLVASLAVDIPEKDNEAAILSDCIETLEKISIKNEIDRIRNKIRIIEDSGKVAPKSIVLELINLQKKNSK